MFRLVVALALSAVGSGFVAPGAPRAMVAARRAVAGDLLSALSTFSLSDAAEAVRSAPTVSGTLTDTGIDFGARQVDLAGGVTFDPTNVSGIGLIVGAVVLLNAVYMILPDNLVGEGGDDDLPELYSDLAPPSSSSSAPTNDEWRAKCDADGVVSYSDFGIRL